MINKTEIEIAQNSWGNGIITIGKLKDNPKECKIFTVNFITKHYDFDSGDVQFKPTKASEKLPTTNHLPFDVSSQYFPPDCNPEAGRELQNENGNITWISEVDIDETPQQNEKSICNGNQLLS